MSPSHHTQVLAPSQWQTYRELRLRALQESPDAFGSTYEIEAAKKPELWRSRLEAAASSNADLPLVAFVDHEPAGLAWAKRDVSDQQVVNLYQMWVAPELRGLGIGRELLERAISWSRGLPARTLQLQVTIADSPAYRLYLRSGFKEYGEPEPLREGSELLAQTLRLSLNESAA